MRIQNKILLGFAIALTITSAASAQHGGMPEMPAETSVAIMLQVGGQPYHFEGAAECQHAPVAFIYSAAAEMWSVHQRDGKRSITLSFWRPVSKSGDIFSLSAATGGKSYLVNTIKPAGESSIQGSGKVTLKTSGAGGAFTINATTAKGAAITGTIKCSAFTDAMAEGG